MEIVPHEGIHVYKMYDEDDDDAFYYHAEARRKCRTTFVGVLLLLNSTRFPSVAISLSVYFNRMFLDRQITNIIVDVFTINCRINERSQASDQ